MDVRIILTILGLVGVALVVAGIVGEKVVSGWVEIRRREIEVMEQSMRQPTATNSLVREIGEAIAKTTAGFGQEVKVEADKASDIAGEVVELPVEDSDFWAALKEIEEDEYMKETDG